MASPLATDASACSNQLTYVVTSWAASTHLHLSGACNCTPVTIPAYSRRQRAAAELAARRRAHEAMGLLWPMRFTPPPLPGLAPAELAPEQLAPARLPWPAALRSFARAGPASETGSPTR